ncbi:MAG: type II toxin-antitoxin system Phd/YefM family antitoxin [Terriglobales bacterium]
MRMGLKEANQQFAKMIRAVRQGKSVVLTDHGKPLAVVEPLVKRRRPGADAAMESAIAAMEAEGVLLRATQPGLMDLDGWKPLHLNGPPLSQTIDEDREDRI